jgi:hypothetical protein
VHCHDIRSVFHLLAHFMASFSSCGFASPVVHSVIPRSPDLLGPDTSCICLQYLCDASVLCADESISARAHPQAQKRSNARAQDGPSRRGFPEIPSSLGIRQNCSGVFALTSRCRFAP